MRALDARLGPVDVAAVQDEHARITVVGVGDGHRRSAARRQPPDSRSAGRSVGVRVPVEAHAVGAEPSVRAQLWLVDLRRHRRSPLRRNLLHGPVRGTVVQQVDRSGAQVQSRVVVRVVEQGLNGSTAERRLLQHVGNPVDAGVVGAQRARG